MPQPVQTGLILTALALLVLPPVAWSQGYPLGALLLLAGGYTLHAMNRRSRRVTLAALLAVLAAAGAWWSGRG